VGINGARKNPSTNSVYNKAANNNSAMTENGGGQMFE